VLFRSPATVIVPFCGASVRTRRLLVPPAIFPVFQVNPF